MTEKIKAETHSDVKATHDAKKWFYTDIVKKHFFKPKNFMTEEIEKKYKADGMGMVGSPACGDMMRVWIKIDRKNDKIKDMKWNTFGSLLPGAKILMKDYSTKAVEELKIGDEIIDGDGKLNYIEEILVKNYNGKIVSIRLSTSKFYDFLLTPNHPVPCIKRKKIASVKRYSKNRWSEVVKSDFENAEPELIAASDLEPGDFMIFKAPVGVLDKKELDDDFCTLLGYYVSDGSCPSKNRVIFYFGLNEEEFVTEIEKIAKRKEWPYRIYKRNTENVICFQLNKSEIVELLKKHGGISSHKKFSEDIMLLPQKKQENIINAYVNGDGWVTVQKSNWNEQFFISTSKEELAYQLQLMLGRIGIFAPIHKREGREFFSRGKKYKNSGEYNLIFKKIKQRSRIKYQQKYQKNDAPPRLESRGLFGARFLDARERPRLESRGFQRSRHNTFLIPIVNVDVRDYNGKIYDPGLIYEPKVYRVKGISLHNCASAIASTSILSVMVKENRGMKIDDALKIKPKDIVDRLGNLPSRKFHCSVLGDKALRAAINDYFRKTGQIGRIVNEGARVIDKDTNVTDKDIEEAVLEGADTLEKIQEKLKAGVSNKSCIPEIEQLIRFYKEKYYGKEEK